MKCDCKCHRTCHSCGQPFIGPNDYHTNCGDSDPASSPRGHGMNGYTLTKDRTEPWPND